MTARLAARGLSVALVASCALSLPAASQADVFEPISLASVGLLEGGSFVEQADVAEHPAVSADGRYVAFDGAFGGVSGVWRAQLLRDSSGRLSTGRIEQVAGGDAQLPSISGDGMLVSFTTNEGKSLPAITNGAPASQPQREAVNVYVRDMSKPAGEAGAFTVASAPSGASEPLTYTTSGFIPEFGAVAAGRSAMSANGRYVAFVTTAESNLAGPNTPARQVAVRDLPTRETKLVSVENEGGPTSRPVATTTEGGTTYGAVYGLEKFPAQGGAALSLGASLSADGSTVAWMGQEIARQAPVFGGSETRPEYIEPLWRKIQPPGPTRRVTGGSNPSEPGPFEPSLRGGAGINGVYAAVSQADVLPRLSGDGQHVAFLASQRVLSGGEEFRGAENSDDLYLVDMASGLTRTQALRRLTEIASGNANIGGGSDPLTDLSVSADGTQIAFTTRRTAFPLGSPAYVSVAEATAGMDEVYDIDLADDTLTRVTHGYESEAQQSRPAGVLAAQNEAASPSFSLSGDMLAFSSAATNLVYGETNGADSAFVVSRKHFAVEAVTQQLSPAPPNPTPQADWRLNVFAHSRRDGSVVLEVEVPGPGRLGASAAGAVPLRARAHHSRRGSRGARRRNTIATTRVATRRLATRAEDAAQEGVVTLTLALAPAYRALATERGGLSALASFVFTAPGHATLQQSIPITFIDRVHRAHRAARRLRGRHRR